MIVKMERLSVFGMIRNKDEMLNKLIRKQCIQFIDPEESLGELALSADLGRVETSAYKERLSRYESVLDEMKPYSDKIGMFQNRPHLTYDELESSEIGESAESLCCKIEKLINELDSINLKKESDIGFEKSLMPWETSDIPLEIKSTASLDVAYFALPPDTDKVELQQTLERDTPPACIEFVHKDKEHIYVIVISHKEHSDLTWEVLLGFNANPIHFGADVKGPPKKNITDVEARLVEYDKEAEKITEMLKDFGSDLSALRYGCDALSLKIQREEANDQLVLTKTTFGFNGWVPVDKKPDVISILDEYNCEYTFEPAVQENEDDPPVLFKNKLIPKSSEAVVQMYSLPSYYSVDPNYVVAPFFSLFFGMMLSDTAYGLILFIGGILALKKLDMSKTMQGVVRTLMFGGFSAIFWGMFFGSWFGDFATVVAKTFFNVDFAMPAFINPLHDPVTVLIMSLSFGVIHIMVGMGVKAYLLIVRGRFWSAVFDVGFWYLVMIGIALFALVDNLSTIGMYIAISGAAGLVLTQGRSKKGFFPKLIGGVASLYNSIGYFSDILSYSRILALGLSTAVIASVFNTMGSMFGGGILGALILLVVFIVGHVFNIMISSFGSYVHTARLQYVEFFGEFYESGGRPFEPYQVVTKYCHVDE